MSLNQDCTVCRIEHMLYIVGFVQSFRLEISKKLHNFQKNYGTVFLRASRPKEADWSKIGNLGLTNRPPTALMHVAQKTTCIIEELICVSFGIFELRFFFELWKYPPTFSENLNYIDHVPLPCTR